MAVRPIDADEYERELLYDMALHGEQLSGDAAYNRALVILTQMPTLTPPNEPLTPCDVCMYNPPSSMGGKLCYICPASPPERQEGAK